MRLTTPIPSLVRVACVAGILTASVRALDQTPAPPPPLANWTGAIRCELQSQAPGYAHQETQTWTLSGAPTVQGSVTVYPATWSVTGQGWHDRTRNTTRRVAQWTVAVPASTRAAIGFTLQPAGGGFDVGKRHAQLTAGGGYTGPEQIFDGATGRPPTHLVATVYEWQFPKIDGATSQSRLVGAKTAPVKAFLGPLQPDDAQSVVTCAWALGRGSTPSLPPSTMTPLSPPSSIAQGGALSSATSATTATTTTSAPTGLGAAVPTGIVGAPSSSPGASTPLAGSSMVAGGQAGGATLGTVTPAPAASTSTSRSTGTGQLPPPPPLPTCLSPTSPSTTVITSMPQRNSSPSLLGSQPAAAPAPAPACVTSAEKLAVLQDYVADALATLSDALLQTMAARPRGAPCPDLLLADIHAAFASLLQTVQAEYAKLLAAATTTTEQNAIAKAESNHVAELNALRDKFIDQVTKMCAQ